MFPDLRQDLDEYKLNTAKLENNTQDVINGNDPLWKLNTGLPYERHLLTNAQPRPQY